MQKHIFPVCRISADANKHLLLRINLTDSRWGVFIELNFDIQLL